MPTGNRARLLSLATREFRRLTDAGQAIPVPRNFKALRLNVSKFDEAWDQRRGAAMRLTSVILREDAATLRDRVCADPTASETYRAAESWLQREARYLRQVTAMLETAAGRLGVVLAQCGDAPKAGASESAP